MPKILVKAIITVYLLVPFVHFPQYLHYVRLLIYYICLLQAINPSNGIKNGVARKSQNLFLILTIVCKIKFTPFC